MLPSTTLQRLSFIKYLFDTGIEQSLQPEPFSTLSVLTFHDSVEMFLHLACEHLDVSSLGRSPTFLDYWDKLSNYQLTQKASMKRLNTARNSFKHSGTMPSKLDIETFRVNVSSFFAENAPILFGMEFDAVSIIPLVLDEKVKSLLEMAESLHNDGMTFDALDRIAAAFYYLIKRQSMVERVRISPFAFSRSSRSFWDKEATIDEGAREGLKGVIDYLDALCGDIDLVAFGIDYSRYSKFKLLTPNVREALDGTLWLSSAPRKNSPIADEYRFCVNFVVESAVKIQNSRDDYHRCKENQDIEHGSIRTSVLTPSDL